MPLSKYLRITIGDQQVEVSENSQVPVSIDYTLEDPENFQNKKSSEVFDLEIPANLNNDRISNTFRNPDIEDLTDGQIFKKSQDAVIEANGYEIFVGKGFLKKGTHSRTPLKYVYNLIGDNGDWLITLKDKTLYDFVKSINFSFSKQNIIDSWQFDGTNEAMPYVFAPVRYRLPMNGYKTNTVDNTLIPDDDNYAADYMRPSLSQYFILYWGFKSVGYRIESNFMNLPYFRRKVMPWTFGNFLDSDGTQLETHKFLAKSTADKYFSAERGAGGKVDQYVDVDVSNDNTNGAFDNNNDYSYNAANAEMVWEYKDKDFGPLLATFSMVIYYSAVLTGSNSDMEVYVEWFLNGVSQKTDIIMQANAGMIISGKPIGQTEIFFSTPTPINKGDKVSAKIHLRLYRDKTAINDVCHINLNVLQFQLDYFRIPIGGNIDFNNYTGFQNKKWVDFLAGIINEHDLSINTDPVNKVVYIEPTHAYSIDNSPIPTQEGYFKEDFIDWNGKEDLSEGKEWEIDNYSDMEKENILGYKDDTNDGILKLIQDRHLVKLTNAKYVLPDRFTTGQKDRTNKFFASTIHFDATQWKSLGTGANTNVSPQMVCIAPENVSNTSQSSSENTFEPKSCYYKGLVTGAGAWRFDGEVRQDYPFMFAVNYQPGGENDPILSYSDELINGVIGKGLLRRFYWQRFAILRNGQWYTTAWFKLKNIDVSRILHREFISYRGQKWELIQINGYKPLLEESTSCLMYKWSPIIQKDFDNSFPSVQSITTGNVIGDVDIKYHESKCLISDLPT